MSKCDGRGGGRGTEEASYGERMKEGEMEREGGRER